jgi:hypothetical protein
LSSKDLGGQGRDMEGQIVPEPGAEANLARPGDAYVAPDASSGGPGHALHKPLHKPILCHSRERSDEQSGFRPAAGRAQIPRFARDDNSRDFRSNLPGVKLGRARLKGLRRNPVGSEWVAGRLQAYKGSSQPSSFIL